MNYRIVNTPSVLKESSAGIFACGIGDVMLADREIHCVGPIDAELANSMCLQLLHLQKEDPDGQITIYFNSPGGEVASGLAIYDVMRAVSCPIRTVCLGTAASAAALLFISGDVREMLPHANVMIHDPLIPGGVGGSALHLQTISENLLRTREITAEIIAEHTGKPLEEIYEATAKDSWFEAPEAVAYGLADRIIERL